jgi:hypothetical protein
MGLLSWLESTAYAEWILGLSEAPYSDYGWPIMLGSHSLGLAIIVGVVIIINLRLLGLYSAIPYTSLAKFLPVAWVGFAINLFTGLSLFTTQATIYITNVPFLTKMTFIILGTANLVFTSKHLKREGAAWESAGTVSQAGTLLAATSLAFWALAIMTGRLIAYI